jgi:hypothetical protein
MSQNKFSFISLLLITTVLLLTIYVYLDSKKQPNYVMEHFNWFNNAVDIVKHQDIPLETTQNMIEQFSQFDNSNNTIEGFQGYDRSNNTNDIIEDFSWFSKLKDKIKHAAQSVSKVASHATDVIKHKASNLSHGTQNALHHDTDLAKQKIQDAHSQIEEADKLAKTDEGLAKSKLQDAAQNIKQAALHTQQTANTLGDKVDQKAHDDLAKAKDTVSNIDHSVTDNMKKTNDDLKHDLKHIEDTSIDDSNKLHKSLEYSTNNILNKTQDSLNKDLSVVGKESNNDLHQIALMNKNVQDHINNISQDSAKLNNTLEQIVDTGTNMANNDLHKTLNDAHSSMKLAQDYALKSKKLQDQAIHYADKALNIQNPS